MQEVLFYTLQPGSRFRYTAQLIFSDILGCSCEFTDDLTFFHNAAKPKISHSPAPVDPHAFFIPSVGLLEAEDICPQKVEIAFEDELPYFFGVSRQDTDLPFDLFAFCFYLVTRYEEYLPFDADLHGRFPAHASLAAQAGFLHLPLVDLWAIRLSSLLRRKFPAFTHTLSSYRCIPTIDVDIALAYGGKPLWKQLGGLGMDLFRGNLARLSTRLRTWLGQIPDSFDTFDQIARWHKVHGQKTRYFFLFSRSGSRKDPNIAPDNPLFRQLIRNLAVHSDIGLHPSYHSLENPGLFLQEKIALEQVLEEAVLQSRQHFIRLQFPETFRQLIKTGILEDYSMGYPDAVGFRAGIARPFKWFDLKKNEPTTLTLYPFQVMDVTLKQYMKLHPQAAMETIKGLVSHTRLVGGCFVSVWHNSSFAPEWGWAGWEAVYRYLLREAVPQPDN